MPFPTVGGYRLEKLLHEHPLGWALVGRRGTEQCHIRVFRPQAWLEVRSEIAICSQLRHRSLWPVLAWGEQDGFGFVVTPFVQPRPLTHLSPTTDDGLFFEALRGALTALETARRAGMRCQHWGAEQFALALGRSGGHLIFDFGIPLQPSPSPQQGTFLARLAQLWANRQPSLTMLAILDQMRVQPDGDLLEAYEALVEASTLGPAEKAELLGPLNLVTGAPYSRTAWECYDAASHALERGDLGVALEHLLDGMEVNPYIPSLLVGEVRPPQAPSSRLGADSVAWARVYATQARDRWPVGSLQFLRQVLADEALGESLSRACQLQSQLQQASLLPPEALADKVLHVRRCFYHAEWVDGLFQRLGLTRDCWRA